MMKRVNIRESLLEIDRATDCQYDLTSLYEACKLDDEDKKKMVQYIEAHEEPAEMGKFLATKCEGLVEQLVDDDDVTDIDKFLKELNDGKGHSLYSLEDKAEIKESAVAGVAMALGTAAATGFGQGLGDKVGSKLLGEDDVDDAYENDAWDDGEVEFGKTFFADGYDWKWMRRVGDVVHLDFDNWAVWMAFRPEDENNPEGRNVVQFFIVDEDTGFIDWGPVDTIKEAQEFLQSKVDDWEMDESLTEEANPSDLKTKLEAAAREFIVNNLGYDDDFVNDYIFIDVKQDQFDDGSEAIKCQIRTELDYDECEQLANALNPIVAAEDKNAYFDMETSNVLVSFLRTDFSDDVVDEAAVAEFAPVIEAITSMERLRELYRDIRETLADVWTYATFEAVHDLIMDKADELNGVNESMSDIDATLDKLGGADAVKARVEETRRAYPGIEDDELVDMLWNDGSREDWESVVQYLSEATATLERPAKKDLTTIDGTIAQVLNAHKDEIDACGMNMNAIKSCVTKLLTSGEVKGDAAAQRAVVIINNCRSLSQLLSTLTGYMTGMNAITNRKTSARKRDVSASITTDGEELTEAAPSQATLDDCLQDYKQNAFGFDGVEDYVETQYPMHDDAFKQAIVNYLKMNESLTEDINDPDEVLDFKRNVEAAEDLVDIENLIWGLSDGVAEEMVQQAFDANQDAEDIQDVKDAVIRELDIYLEDNEWLGEAFERVLDKDGNEIEPPLGRCKCGRALIAGEGEEPHCAHCGRQTYDESTSITEAKALTVDIEGLKKSIRPLCERAIKELGLPIASFTLSNGSLEKNQRPVYYSFKFKMHLRGDIKAKYRWEQDEDGTINLDVSIWDIPTNVDITPELLYEGNLERIKKTLRSYIYMDSELNNYKSIYTDKLSKVSKICDEIGSKYSIKLVPSFYPSINDLDGTPDETITLYVTPVEVEGKLGNFQTVEYRSGYLEYTVNDISYSGYMSFADHRFSVPAADFKPVDYELDYNQIHSQIETRIQTLLQYIDEIDNKIRLHSKAEKEVNLQIQVINKQLGSDILTKNEKRYRGIGFSIECNVNGKTFNDGVTEEEALDSNFWKKYMRKVRQRMRSVNTPTDNSRASRSTNIDFDESIEFTPQNESKSIKEGRMTDRYKKMVKNQFEQEIDASDKSHEIADDGLSFKIVRANGVVLEYNAAEGYTTTEPAQIKESDETEDKPYTYRQVFDELKLETKNFTVKDGAGRYGYESEANHAVKILEKHYASVELDRVGSWFQVDFKDLKKKAKKEELEEAVIEMTADEMKAKYGTDNPDIINTGRPEEDGTVVLKESSYRGDELSELFDWLQTYDAGRLYDAFVVEFEDVEDEELDPEQILSWLESYDADAYYDLMDSELYESKSIKEATATHIYLFPELTAEDIDMLKAYSLKFLGKNHGADGSEDNWVVAGTEPCLNRYASNWLGYELHPGYLYNADDFAGDIITEEVYDMKIGNLSESKEVTAELKVWANKIADCIFKLVQDGQIPSISAKSTGVDIMKVKNEDYVRAIFRVDGSANKVVQMCENEEQVAQIIKQCPYEVFLSDNEHYVKQFTVGLDEVVVNVYKKEEDAVINQDTSLPSFDAIDSISSDELHDVLYDCVLQVNDSLSGGQSMSTDEACSKAFEYFVNIADDNDWNYTASKIRNLITFIINNEFTW